MISCVERTSLHFCSDAAAARVANTPMQPSGASHRLCEAYCQRLTGRSFPDAHAAFHDVFFRSEPSARCGRSGRVVGASRRPVRSWDAPRRLSCPAEACSRWPLARCGPDFSACIMHACTPEAVLGGRAHLGRSSGRNYFLLTVHFVTPLASLPWPRRASRVVARGSRVLGGVVGPSRLARRAFSIESGRSPNQPATA